VVDYDRRLRQLESRALASDDDDNDFSELIRKRTEQLIPADELAELRSQPPDPKNPGPVRGDTRCRNGGKGQTLKRREGRREFFTSACFLRASRPHRHRRVDVQRPRTGGVTNHDCA
jgi:hypothetical protein